MILFSRYLASHLQTEPEERTVAAEQGVPFELKVRVKNTGRVPVGRFAIKTVSGRAGKKKKYRNRDGDPVRRIHWNQTARTGTVCVEKGVQRESLLTVTGREQFGILF